MKIDGHCHCGRIGFEAEVDPASVTICHCTDCQRLTGSAFRANVRAPAAQFVLLGGAPKSYVKTAESGNKRRHAFCGDCGTPLYACALEDPQTYSLRLGTITQRAALGRRLGRRAGAGEGLRHRPRPARAAGATRLVAAGPRDPCAAPAPGRKIRSASDRRIAARG